MHGRIVSKEHVLKELGHPGTWGANHRHIEFRSHLSQIQTDLDFRGIKGYPGHIGYLEFLENELKNPFGAHTGLVSEEENQQIREKETIAIQAEIDKYRPLLAQYEKDPNHIYEYVADIQWWLNCREKTHYNNPELIGDEWYDRVMLESHERDAESLQALRERVIEYTVKYQQMTGKKLDKR